MVDEASESARAQKKKGKDAVAGDREGGGMSFAGRTNATGALGTLHSCRPWVQVYLDEYKCTQVSGTLPKFCGRR